MSSTMPSAKYSCSGSPLRLVNGSTAIDGLSGSGRLGGAGAAPGARAAPAIPSLGSVPSRTSAHRRHSPGTPLSSCRPRSLKSRPDPATRSRRVPDTRTSPGRAADITLLAMCTAIPPIFLPAASASPACKPARIERPSLASAATIASAARTASAGCSKMTKNPSPAVSTSRPRNRWSSRRTAAWWSATSCCHARSPSLTARSVDPTISVKRIVARNRSGDRRDRNTRPAALKSETGSQ